MLAAILILAAQLVPREAELPAGWDASRHVVLQGADGKKTAGQIDGKRVVFLAAPGSA